MIASSHRTDKNSLRVILGNDIAIQAARAKHTNPWPEGSILAKLVWEDKTHDAWSTATVPGSFVHAEFMVKDSQKYFSTGGWGFARWLGLEQRPYGSDASFVTECMGCHTQEEYGPCIHASRRASVTGRCGSGHVGPRR